MYSILIFELLCVLKKYVFPWTFSTSRGCNFFDNSKTEKTLHSSLEKIHYASFHANMSLVAQKTVGAGLCRSCKTNTFQESGLSADMVSS